MHVHVARATLSLANLESTPLQQEWNHAIPVQNTCIARTGVCLPHYIIVMPAMLALVEQNTISRKMVSQAGSAMKETGVSWAKKRNVLRVLTHL